MEGGVDLGGEDAGEFFEMGGVAGGEDGGGRAGVKGRVVFGDAASDGGSGVDEVQVGRQASFERGAQKGIVGAAEDEDVGVVSEHGGGVFVDGAINFGAVEDARFDEFDEFGAGLGDDAEVAGVLGDKVVEFFALERGFGGENADGVGLGESGGGFDAGFHADEGDEVLGAECLDRDDGGGVAGNDDEFDPLFEEKVGEGEGAVADRGEAFVPVRAPSVVADVDDGEGGEEGLNFAEHGEPAHSRVKDADHGLIFAEEGEESNPTKKGIKKADG